MNKIILALVLLTSSSIAFSSIHTVLCNGVHLFDGGKSEVNLTIKIENEKSLTLKSFIFEKNFYLYDMNETEPVLTINPHERIGDWGTWNASVANNAYIVSRIHRGNVKDNLKFDPNSGKGEYTTEYYANGFENYSMNCTAI